MEEKIKACIEEIRPMIQSHGGDVEFVSLEGTTVKVRLQGACHSCPHAMATLKNGVEQILREQVDPALTVERA